MQTSIAFPISSPRTRAPRLVETCEGCRRRIEFTVRSVERLPICVSCGTRLELSWYNRVIAWLQEAD